MPFKDYEAKYAEATRFSMQKAGRSNSLMQEWRETVLEFYGEPSDIQGNSTPTSPTSTEGNKPTEQVEELDEDGLTREQRDILDVVIDHLPELPKRRDEGNRYWIPAKKQAKLMGIECKTLRNRRAKVEKFDYNEFVIGRSDDGISVSRNDNRYAVFYFKEP